LAPDTEAATDEEAGAEFCAAAAEIAQTNTTNIVIGKRNLAEVIADLIKFFLYRTKARGILRYFACRRGGTLSGAGFSLWGLVLHGPKATG